MQFLYSFGFNVQHFWHIELFVRNESLHGVLSRLYHIGLIARYRGIHIIGVKRNTSKTDIIWKNELSVLAEMSLAVRMIAIIQKKAIIATIIIAKFLEVCSSHHAWNNQLNCSNILCVMK